MFKNLNFYILKVWSLSSSQLTGKRIRLNDAITRSAFYKRLKLILLNMIKVINNVV